MITSVPLVRFPAPLAGQNPILAAIDIGTNSLHLVVVKIDPNLPTFTIIDQDKETVRLGAVSYTHLTLPTTPYV